MPSLVVSFVVVSTGIARSARSGWGTTPPSSARAAGCTTELATAAGRLAIGAGSALACGLAGCSGGSVGAPPFAQESASARRNRGASARITSGFREIADDAHRGVERGGPVEVLRIDEDRVGLGVVPREHVA